MPMLDDIMDKVRLAADRVMHTAESPTEQALRRGGSVMTSSREAERESLRNQGPLMYTLLNMLKGGGLDPTTAGGPSQQAGISALHWLPEVKGGLGTINPEAKFMMNTVANKFPEFFKKILKSETPLLPNVKTTPGYLEAGGPALGVQQTFRPTTRMAQMAGDPNLANQPTHALLNVILDEAKSSHPDTAIHELQHYLNFPRVQATNPEDAATIGTLLSDLLPKGKGQSSLQYRMGQYAEEAPMGVAGKPSQLVSQPDLTKVMLEHGPNANRPFNQGEGGYKPGESLLDYVSRAMMDEGYAHLSERTLNPGGDKGLMDLTNKLGVGTGLKHDASNIGEGSWMDVLDSLKNQLGGQ